MQEARGSSTEHLRDIWILELLDALCLMEDLGYLHGDISISNISIDHDTKRLKIFDFGSAVHHSDEDFSDQILEDQSRLATCIYFLASGIDPFAEVQSFADIKRIRQSLQQGAIPFPAAAKRVQPVLEDCLSRKRSNSFKHLKQTVSGILGAQTVRQLAPSLTMNRSWGTELSLERFARDERWLNEEDYRIAWSSKGFDCCSDEELRAEQ